LLKRLHQCNQTSHLNDLNNFNNYLDIDKINSQLERAEIQKRVLNASRGPAVWALRAQTDKREYSKRMIEILQNTDNLSLKEAMITELDISKTEEIGLNSKKNRKKKNKGC